MFVPMAPGGDEQPEIEGLQGNGGFPCQQVLLGSFQQGKGSSVVPGLDKDLGDPDGVDTLRCPFFPCLVGRQCTLRVSELPVGITLGKMVSRPVICSRSLGGFPRLGQDRPEEPIQIGNFNRGEDRNGRKADG